MSNFIPCTVLPADLSPYWIKAGYGGINPCILGNPQPPGHSDSVLANCVGWAWGRFAQCLNDPGSCALSTGNAVTFWTHADGYERGSEPKLGAVVCYSGGSIGTGHVGIVEEIAEDGSYIKTSNSNYGSSIFDYWTFTRANNWAWGPGSDITFQGFIYNPDVSGGGSIGTLTTGAKVLLLKKRGVF